MFATGFIDFLLIIAAVVMSWRMYYAAQPPPTGTEQRPGDGGAAAATPALARGDSGGSLPQRLQAICTAAGMERIEPFLDGARAAHEAIVTDFAAGKLEDRLLTDEVREVFAAVLQGRASRGETVEMTFVGTQAADITDARIEGRLARISVRFIDLLAAVTRNKAGAIVAGHPTSVGEVVETWTFERELGSANPNWRLAATEAGS